MYLKKDSISFSIVSIATGTKYLNYWLEMVKSFDKFDSGSNKVVFYLLTSERKLAEYEIKNINQEFRIFDIPSYGWPEATLLRYQEILKIYSYFAEDIIIYLDADMLVCSDLIAEIVGLKFNGGIGVVLHPGYWRAKGWSLLKFYIHNPLQLSKDCVRKIKIGGLGTWETNNISSAFVRRRNRNKYVCGGIWFGYKKELFTLVKDCSFAVDEDLQHGYIAIWHDESHLNKWCSRNEVTFLPPSFCYDPSYKNLNSLREVVRAVVK